MICGNASAGADTDHEVDNIEWILQPEFDETKSEPYQVMDSDTGTFETPNPYEDDTDITVGYSVPEGKQLVVRPEYFYTELDNDGVELVVDGVDQSTSLYNTTDTLLTFPLLK